MLDITPSLSGLANELLQMIVTNVDPKDLKNLRLTCRSLNNLSTAPLFQEITLLPMRGCLEGFASVLYASRQLSPCIQTIHYNEIWHDYFEYHDDTEKWHGAKKDLLRPARSMDRDFELLRTIFRLLPELRNAHVHGQGCGLGTYDSPFEYPPKYLQRVFGLPAPNWSIDPQEGMNIPSSRQGSTAVFAALARAGPQLRSFSGTGFNPRNFMDRNAEFVSSGSGDRMLSLAKGLKHLDVSFEGYISSLESLPACLVTFLRATPNLESLKLDFCHNCRLDVQFVGKLRDDPTKLMRSLKDSDMHFASLKTFALKNAVCKQEDLEAFLFRHSKTLQSLDLHDLALTPTGSHFSCGVKLLENIRDHFNLEHFTMMGPLNNAGEQDILFRPEPPADTGLYCGLVKATSAWMTGETDKIPEVLRLVAIRGGRDDFEPSNITEAERAETGLLDVMPSMRPRRILSREELDRMIEAMDEAMEAFGLAGNVEEDSDGESYYSASEDV